MSRILVIAAHPDDEVLGCGGTIARATARGDEVRILILATGITSRLPDPEDPQHALVEQLEAQARAASAALGVRADGLSFGGLPDQMLDTLPRIDIIRILRDAVASFEPDVVYTHHAGDYNLDHRIVFDATLAAVRPYAGEPHPARVYAYETVSSTEWGWQPRDAFRPTAYVDISDHLEAKQQALAAYALEMRTFPHPRSPEAIDALARRRGSEVSRPAAEAFETIRTIEA